MSNPRSEPCGPRREFLDFLIAPSFALWASESMPPGGRRPGPVLRSPRGEAGWWSQTGSNRRPHACKARALPTELWPLLRPTGFGGQALCCEAWSGMVGPGRFELPTSRLSGVRSNQLSYGPSRGGEARLAGARGAWRLGGSRSHRLTSLTIVSLRPAMRERETKTAASRTCVVSVTNQ